jgi:hypothetical protein
VDDFGGARPYQRGDTLLGSRAEQALGMTIRIKGFPNDHQVQWFRVEASTHRTDWVVTNDRTQHPMTAAHQACGYRWKIEQWHREGQQVTGLERCQGRLARIQRNHMACALLVWGQLKQWARSTGRTVYSLKQGLLDNYLCQQIKNPSLRMKLA